MRIAIIDDEPVIGEGIAKLVASIQADWEIAGIFTDAQEALELCNWDEIQVALADIDMPHLNGLEMLSLLQKRGHRVFVIFITAHARFDYAQAALQGQALDYLLKPVSRKDLQTALQKAASLWKYQLARESDASYISENLLQLRKHFLSDLLFEERFLSPAEIERGIERYQLNGSHFALAIFPSEGSTGEARERLQMLILPQHGVDWFFYRQKPYDLVLLVFQPPLIEAFENVLRKAYRELHFAGDIPAAERLPKAYQELLQTLHPRPEESDLDEALPDPLTDKEFGAPVMQTLQYIRNHYNKKLSLKNISEQVYLHPTYLSNVFKKQTGFTVVDYINVYRILQAQKMLHDPNNKIYWVMEQVGFVNERYFCEVFKRVSGMTPTQYKQNSFLVSIRRQQ